MRGFDYAGLCPQYHLPVAVTRCGNIYGGGDLNWDRIVPGTIRSVLRGESPVIRSDGSPLRDYLFVDDIVNGYLRLAERLDDTALYGQGFNFGMDDPRSALDMARSLSPCPIIPNRSRPY